MTCPFISTEVLNWANRKDLPKIWLRRIDLARNEIDWRTELSYVYECWKEEEDEEAQ